jgi:hypothetical protein
MKMLLLALTALTLSFGAARADSTSVQFAVVSVPSTLTAHASAPAASTLSSSASNFAQLDTHARMVPISSGMVLALIALFVVALRIMGVNHARAMADHERHSHHGKAQMFRSLHEKHSSR